MMDWGEFMQYIIDAVQTTIIRCDDESNETVQQ
jgi:hypothetical protein